MKDSTKSKLRETILFKPDLYVFVNIAIAVGINLIGFFGARALSLPLWLDTIGTMLVSIAYGPLAGVIAARWAYLKDPFRAACSAVWLHAASSDALVSADPPVDPSLVNTAAKIGSLRVSLERK